MRPEWLSWLARSTCNPRVTRSIPARDTLVFPLAVDHLRTGHWKWFSIRKVSLIRPPFEVTRLWLRASFQFFSSTLWFSVGRVTGNPPPANIFGEGYSNPPRFLKPRFTKCIVSILAQVVLYGLLNTHISKPRSAVFARAPLIALFAELKHCETSNGHC